MSLVAVLSKKGGPGKSTTAQNLAVASADKGKKTLLVDMNLEQQTSVIWAGRRHKYEQEHGSKVKGLLEVRAAGLRGADGIPSFYDVIKQAADEQFQFVVVDTPPASNPENMIAARAAPLSLVVIRPNIADIDTLADTFTVVSAVEGTDAYVLLNQVPSLPVTVSARVLEEARDAVQKRGRLLTPEKTTLFNRQIYADAMAAGLGVIEAEPKGKASEEVRELYAWVKRQLPAQKGKRGIGSVSQLKPNIDDLLLPRRPS